MSFALSSIQYRDTRDDIVIVVPISGIAQHYCKQRDVRAWHQPWSSVWQSTTIYHCQMESHLILVMQL